MEGRWSPMLYILVYIQETLLNIWTDEENKCFISSRLDKFNVKSMDKDIANQIVTGIAIGCQGCQETKSSCKSRDSCQCCYSKRKKEFR